MSEDSEEERRTKIKHALFAYQYRIIGPMAYVEFKKMEYDRLRSKGEYVSRMEPQFRLNIDYKYVSDWYDLFREVIGRPSINVKSSEYLKRFKENWEPKDVKKFVEFCVNYKNKDNKILFTDDEEGENVFEEYEIDGETMNEFSYNLALDEDGAEDHPLYYGTQDDFDSDFNKDLMNFVNDCWAFFPNNGTAGVEDLCKWDWSRDTIHEFFTKTVNIDTVLYSVFQQETTYEFDGRIFGHIMSSLRRDFPAGNLMRLLNFDEVQAESAHKKFLKLPYYAKKSDLRDNTAEHERTPVENARIDTIVKFSKALRGSISQTLIKEPLINIKSGHTYEAYFIKQMVPPGVFKKDPMTMKGYFNQNDLRKNWMVKQVLDVMESEIAELTREGEDPETGEFIPPIITKKKLMDKIEE